VFLAIWWSIMIFVMIFVLKIFLHNNWLLHPVIWTLVQYFSFSFYPLPLSLVRDVMHTFKSYFHGDVRNVETMDEASMELDLISQNWKPYNWVQISKSTMYYLLHVHITSSHHQIVYLFQN
jgi:hypothetical protein